MNVDKKNFYIECAENSSYAECEKNAVTRYVHHILFFILALPFNVKRDMFSLGVYIDFNKDKEFQVFKRNKFQF